MDNEQLTNNITKTQIEPVVLTQTLSKRNNNFYLAIPFIVIFIILIMFAVDSIFVWATLALAGITLLIISNIRRKKREKNLYDLGFRPKFSRSSFNSFVFIMSILVWLFSSGIYEGFHNNRGEFDGLPQSFLFIAVAILFSVLLNIFYDISRKKEENAFISKSIGPNIPYKTVIVASAIVAVILSLYFVKLLFS